MKLEELLAGFDTIGIKNFDDFSIRSAINTLLDPEKQRQETQFELLIHSLRPNPEGNEWGTYLGPFAKGRKADGTPTEFPDLASITPDLVDYSYKRMQQTQNPWMKQRYAAVCWDFYRYHQMQMPSDVHDTYYQALIDTIEGDYESHPVCTVVHIRRVFSLSNNNNLPAVKSTIRNFVIRHGQDDMAPGLWGVELDLIIANRKKFTEQEKAVVVNEHEARLLRLNASTQPSIEFTIKEQATLLADYYKADATPDNRKRVLMVMENAFRQSFNVKNAMQQMACLQLLSYIYTTYQLHSEAKRLYADIQQASLQVPAQMQTVQATHQLTPEEVNAFQTLITQMTSGDIATQLNLFKNRFTPQISEIDKLVQRYAANSILNLVATTQMMDEKGRPMSVLGTVEDDYAGNLAYYASMHYHIDAQTLRSVIERHTTNGLFDTNFFVGKVSSSPYFQSNRIDLIRHALDLYFSQDYITFCHLIVPQIEDAIRNIVESNGYAVIKQQPKGNKGYQHRTLDELLNEQVITDKFSADGAFYLRTVLTNQKSYNIRNMLCHGIANPNNFGVVAADRLLHVLYLITTI